MTERCAKCGKASTQYCCGQPMDCVVDEMERLKLLNVTYQVDVQRLKGEVERLQRDADMACIDPRDDCDCAGCRCAAERNAEIDDSLSKPNGVW